MKEQIKAPEKTKLSNEEIANLSEAHFKTLVIGDCYTWCGPSSHSERPVESEVQHTGPRPTDRFSCGGIRPALYLGRFETCFFLKTPSP